MADQEEDQQEKTEEPTQRKLDKAREDGQIARSRELTTFIILLAGLGALIGTGGSLYHGMGSTMESAFRFDRAVAFDPHVTMMHGRVLGERALWMVMPIFMAMVVIALIAPNLLSGPLISAKSLKPQFSRLNPIKGLKRMFSEQALVELFKVIAKSTLVGGVFVLFLMSKIDEFRALMGQSLYQALANTFVMSVQATALMVLTLIVVAMIDVPFQIFQHTKKLRMTKYDVKKEHKESEGDPMVKSRVRALQQEMAKGRMMDAVPEASVVLTNPTHFAVALKYSDDLGVPIVVAKGRNEIAAKIREIALENNVPMMRAPPLARAIYHNVDLEREIPMELYTAVAQVLAWAFSIKRNERVPEPTNLPVPDDMDQGPEQTSEEDQ